jgi:hypothetical protein
MHNPARRQPTRAARVVRRTFHQAANAALHKTETTERCDVHTASHGLVQRNARHSGLYLKEDTVARVELPKEAADPNTDKTRRGQ